MKSTIRQTTGLLSTLSSDDRDLWSLVSDRKDEMERGVLYVGNVKADTTIESLVTNVMERAKMLESGAHKC